MFWVVFLALWGVKCWFHGGSCFWNRNVVHSGGFFILTFVALCILFRRQDIIQILVGTRSTTVSKSLFGTSWGECVRVFYSTWDFGLAWHLKKFVTLGRGLLSFRSIGIEVALFDDLFRDCCTKQMTLERNSVEVLLRATFSLWVNLS